MKKSRAQRRRIIRKSSLMLLATTCLSSMPMAAFAQGVEAANGATNVYQAGNGTTVVDIAKANQAGLSHNQFKDYNVTPKGLVLNNGNYEKLARQSQLAGAVGANMNLDREARVILNEVVTTRRSDLRGYTEVLGGAADVVVANPNGITCDGCGFINTPNVTLTTGRPQIDPNGTLGGFAVSQGMITVEGAGLDATGQDYLALVSRSAEIDAQINANTLDIVTGVNEMDYDTKAVTKGVADGDAPAYAIDSSSLGGMYVDRIRLVATEDGVGVKMLGDVAANAGDFTLDANGKIELANNVSAKESIAIASNGAGSDSIKATDTRLSAEKDVTLAATGGEVHLTGGMISAGEDLTVTSASLKDEKSSTSATDNNKRYAKGDVTLTQSGAVSLDGTSWGADEGLDVTAASVTVGGNGAALYGNVVDVNTSGAITLADAQIRATDALNLASAASGTISTGSAGMLQSDAGDVTLRTGGAISSAGKVLAKGGDLFILADGDVTNSGTLYASNDITLQGNIGSRLLNASNSGTIFAGRDALLSTSALTNTAAGLLQSGRNLALKVATSVVNNVSGRIISGVELAIEGLDNVYSVTNSGLLQAGGLLSVKGYGGANGAWVYNNHANAEIIGGSIDMLASTVSLTNNGGMTAEGNLTLNIDNLIMSGADSYIVAASTGTGIGTINLADGYIHEAGIFSGDDLTISLPWLTNNSTGGIGANGDLTVTTTSFGIDNHGSFFGGNLLKLASASQIFNNATGTMDATNDIDLTATKLVNHNNIVAGRNLTVSAGEIVNEIKGGDKRAWGDNVWKKYGNGNNIDGSSAYHVNEEGISGSYDETHYYEQEWYREQYYTDGGPSAADRPLLVAGSNSGSTLKLTGFDKARNFGGIMSGYNVVLEGNSGSTFTNDSYDLKREDRRRTWNNWCDRTLPTDSCDWTNNRSDSTWLTDSSTVYSTGAAIYAHNLTGNGFGLVNNSSPFAKSVSSYSETGATAKTGESGSSFNGITISLPTNPNGYFIVSKDPNSKYLIETNPRYDVSSSFFGSNFMADLLGLDIDLLQKRLGDANYESSIIRQQLLQLGAAELINTGDEGAAMQNLMNAGATQAGELGLEFGKAPTSEQLANIGSDMVWMVETEVNGEKVLAPVVYLSEATKQQIGSGAILTASNMNLDVTSVTNTGGTIQGADTLAIASQGDIRNTSGSITGGDVQLASTDGSIINETLAVTSGSGNNVDTTIGNTASIGATGDLDLDAKNDITNRGAEMSAGGNASLDAGGDIVFDTIEDKTATERHGSDGNKTTYDSSKSTTNIGSNLTVGGDLDSTSGGDTVIRGSDVDVGGNGNVHAGGNLKIVDAQDTSETTHSSSESGMGVGGGVYGTKTVDETHAKGTSVGSNVNFGGDTNLSTDNTMTVQGSNVATGGDMNIDAQEVEVLEGRNYESTTRTETTTSYLKLRDNESSVNNQADSGATATAEGQRAEAGASASASSDRNASGGVSLYESNSTTSNNYKSDGTASSLTSGGNMNIQAENDVTVQGSDVASGGDMGIDAENLNVLAAQNTETSSTTSTTTGIGFYGSTENNANASANAGASAYAEGGTAAANASADASAGASSNNTLNLMETNTSSDASMDLTHRGSTIKSGGNMNLEADNQMNIAGSDIESGGDLNMEATDMNITAVHDVHLESSSSDTTTVGLYADASAGADASASAGAQGTYAGVNAGASAAANLDVGFQGKNNKESSSSGSTTAQTSSIKSGGDMTRNASGKITDEGTQIEAGGDFNQSAAEWESKAAEDTSFSTSSSEENTARLGLYAEANAGASYSADTMGNNENVSGAGAQAGIKASYNRNTSDESASSSQAVVSNIQSGGNMNIETEGKTSLEGTNLDSGGDMALETGSLDYKAARDTKTSTSSHDNIDAGAKVGLDVKKKVNVTVEGGYEQGSVTESSSNAVTGSMNSGGNMNIKVKDDATFEGTNIAAEKDVGLSTGGDLNFEAARDTSSRTEEGMNASASLSLSKSVKSGKGSSGGTGGSGGSGGGKKSTGMGFQAEGGYNTSTETADEAVTGSIKSGGNMDISSGNDATFEGTDLYSGGDMAVSAKNDVSFDAAESHYTEDGWDVSAEVNLSKGGTDKKGKTKATSMGVGAAGGYNTMDQTTSEVSDLSSGGKVTVKSGNDVNLEGTNITSADKTTLDAGNDVNFTAATDTTDGFAVGGGIGAERTKAAKGGNKADNGTAGNISFELGGEKSTTKTAGSINAGSIEINSGNDTMLEGTKTSSTGGTSINAGGDVNLKAAKSENIGGEFGMQGGSGGMAALDKAAIEGGVNYDGVEMNSGGDVNITSGGKTRMEGTVINTQQDANIDAKGGLEKSTTVSGGMALGMDRADVDLDVQETQINTNGKKGVGFFDKLKNQVKDTFTDGAKKVENTANEVGGAVQSGVSDIGNSLKSTADTTQQTASDNASQVAGAVAGVAQEIKLASAENTKGAGAQVETEKQKQPVEQSKTEQPQKPGSKVSEAQQKQDAMQSKLEGLLKQKALLESKGKAVEAAAIDTQIAALKAEQKKEAQPKKTGFLQSIFGAR